MSSTDRVSSRSPAASTRSKRALLLIANPGATAVAPGMTERLAQRLGEGYRVDVELTSRSGQAAELARAAAEQGYPLVAALGGDGTVSEAANGLAGSDTALACLPGGRTNVFCRTLGYGNQPEKAVERLLSIRHVQPRRRVDLGVLNDRYFTFASGVGFSATLNRRVAEREGFRGPLNAPFLLFEVASTLRASYVGELPLLRVQVDGDAIEAVTMVLQNSSPLTYLGAHPIEVCDGAGLDTGTLSMTLLRRSRALALPGIVARVLRGPAVRVQSHPWVKGSASLEQLRVASGDERPVPVEVDGDYLGELDELRYGVAPGKLLVVGRGSEEAERPSGADGRWS
jgi:diacylglycerol kinase family enzyme